MAHLDGPVPINPDGTPNYGAGTGTSLTDSSGALSIWNLPTDLPAGIRIWFDVGHKKPPASGHSEKGKAVITDLLTPGSDIVGPGSGVDAVLGNDVPHSHEIIRSPAQVMKQIAALSANDPNKFLAIQQALASGAWGTVGLTGAFDPATEKALGVAMLQYVKLSKGAGVGESFTDYLVSTSQRSADLAAKAAAAKAAAGIAARVTQVSDPEEIRSAAQSAAQAALGQGLSDDQLSAFVAQFQAAQTTAQQAGPGATSTSPDLGAEAMQFAQSSDPGAYKQNQRQVFLNALVNMAAPSGSQRPDMTPVPSAGGAA